MLKILKHRQWHEEYRPDDQGNTWYYNWVDPAIAQCVCGSEIELDADPSECPRCKRLYNMSGQELMPRQFWENDW